MSSEQLQPADSGKSFFSFIFKKLELILILVLSLAAIIHYHLSPASNSLKEIVDSKMLRVLISDEPDAQYLFNKQRFGFEFTLLETYADSLGVELTLEVVPYGELFSLLNNGNADIAIGGILESPFVNNIIQPTIAWHTSSVAVTYKRGEKRPKKIADIKQQPIHASARYYQLKQFSELNIVDDHRSEYSLLNAVSNGTIKYAISSNYRARTAKHYLPNLNRGFILKETVNLVWALPKQQNKALLNSVNQYLETAIENDLPEVLAGYYLNLPKKLNTFDVLGIHRRINNILPEFETRFQKAAKKSDLDWFLLAAISYQESHWSNDAVSPTGVKGIMQLTNETADFLKVADRLDIDASIIGAARYMKFLKSKLPKRIQEPQRTWFAVGAYNIGLGHILEAYKKARALGLDAQQWDVISLLLPTLYGDDFPRGVQCQDYVERIQIFTDILRFYDIHQRHNISTI